LRASRRFVIAALAALLEAPVPATVRGTPSLASAPAAPAPATRADTVVAAAELGVVPAVPRLLTLPAARDLALRHNPGLAAAAWRIRAAGGRALDARRRPELVLEASAENWGGALGTDRLETTVALSQRLELGGDRGARGAVARAEERLAGLEFDGTERALSSTVTEDFLTAWLAQERLGRLRDAERIAIEAVATAGDRVKAGAAAPVERVRAEGALALHRADLRRAEADHAIALRTLALDWGGVAVEVDSLILDPPDVTPPPPPERLLARLDRHPDRMRREVELALGEARLHEVRASRIPDLEARFGVRRLDEAGGTGFVAGVAIPVPVWGSRRGAVRAAESERSEAQARRRQAALGLEGDLRSLHDRLRAAIDAFAIVRDLVLPSTEEALGSLRAGYRSGRLGYVDLLEGQRAALEAQLVSVAATRDVWSARLALDRLVGALPGPAGGTEER
jgi:cobalt-zinc-cadmium efflux system outer membrane protein